MSSKNFSSFVALLCCLACGNEALETSDAASTSSEAPTVVTPECTSMTAPTEPVAPAVVEPAAPVTEPAASGVVENPPPSAPITMPSASMAPSEMPAVATVPASEAPEAPSTMQTVPPAPPCSPGVEPDAPPSPTPAPTLLPDGAPTSEPVSAPADGFQLLWEDPFDSLDTTRWAAQTHSWDGNLAQFTADNVAVTDGRLQLLLTPSGNAEKPFDGVEYRSRDTITYGKVEASIRFAKGSGVVSSLVLIYTPWPPDDWNELDIECLGNTTGEVQFNHMVNIPPADPVTEHLQFPEKIDLGFDPTLAFHTYTIEWLPESVRFLVDAVVIHEATEEISRLRLPQNVLLTIWASDAASWAGPIDDTSAPTSAEVDWLRLYSYAAP